MIAKENASVKEYCIGMYSAFETQEGFPSARV